jgi:hypothetical protein
MLAKLYLQFVESGASIDDIARAYESESLPVLMKSRGLDLSFFEANGIFTVPISRSAASTAS